MSSNKQEPGKQESGLFPSLSNLPKMASQAWGDLFGELTAGGDGDQKGLTISEDKENIYVEAAMPGLKADNIEVNLEKGILWVKGEKQEEEQDKDKKYYRKAVNSYSYRLALPGNIDDSIEPKATYQDGIMKIVFKKNQHNQGKKIKVKGA